MDVTAQIPGWEGTVGPALDDEPDGPSIPVERCITFGGQGCRRLDQPHLDAVHGGQAPE